MKFCYYCSFPKKQSLKNNRLHDTSIIRIVCDILSLFLIAMCLLWPSISYSSPTIDSIITTVSAASKPPKEIEISDINMQIWVDDDSSGPAATYVADLVSCWSNKTNGVSIDSILGVFLSSVKGKSVEPCVMSHNSVSTTFWPSQSQPYTKTIGHLGRSAELDIYGDVISHKKPYYLSAFVNPAASTKSLDQVLYKIKEMYDFWRTQLLATSDSTLDAEDSSSLPLIVISIDGDAKKYDKLLGVLEKFKVILHDELEHDNIKLRCSTATNEQIAQAKTMNITLFSDTFKHQTVVLNGIEQNIGGFRKGTQLLDNIDACNEANKLKVEKGMTPNIYEDVNQKKHVTQEDLFYLAKQCGVGIVKLDHLPEKLSTRELYFYLGWVENQYLLLECNALIHNGVVNATYNTEKTKICANLAVWHNALVEIIKVTSDGEITDIVDHGMPATSITAWFSTLGNEILMKAQCDITVTPKLSVICFGAIWVSTGLTLANKVCDILGENRTTAKQVSIYTIKTAMGVFSLTYFFSLVPIFYYSPVSLSLIAVSHTIKYVVSAYTGECGPRCICNEDQANIEIDMVIEDSKCGAEHAEETLLGQPRKLAYNLRRKAHKYCPNLTKIIMHAKAMTILPWMASLLPVALNPCGTAGGNLLKWGAGLSGAFIGYVGMSALWASPSIIRKIYFKKNGNQNMKCNEIELDTRINIINEDDNV
ncbi:MAG: hypothetical protein QS721_11725 [Candidatus Endonucleobacter sp. (ex Gigantidas childressi)]|nr:hypothetical protein [Candidatus Endonucleobacter sp. (ex Gigantidas childressi)]